ncbi:MAG: hypothetical protein ACOYK7_03975 [Pirellulales bacterium]
MSSEGVEEYRPVSWLAVAAAVGGCASAVALLGPVFWAVPLLGVLLALVALADVGRDGDRRVGRFAALAGLFLAVGFGAQAVGSHLVNRWVARQRAIATARHWVTTVHGGRLDDAAAMLAPSAIDRGLAMPGQEDTPSQLLERHPVYGQIRRCGGEPSVTATIEGTVPNEPDLWIAAVRLAPCPGAVDDTISLQMLVRSQRLVRKGRVYDAWQVVRLPGSQPLVPNE